MGPQDPNDVARDTARDLSGLAGELAPVHLAPLAVDAEWDAARVDGVWHRVLWVSEWPTAVSDPAWLEPLVLAPPCIRALSVTYEPVSPRASRRAITAEAVSVESQLQARDRYGLRAGVELQRAQSDVDQIVVDLESFALASGAGDAPPDDGE